MVCASVGNDVGGEVGRRHETPPGLVHRGAGRVSRVSSPFTAGNRIMAAAGERDKGRCMGLMAIERKRVTACKWCGRPNLAWFKASTGKWWLGQVRNLKGGALAVITHRVHVCPKAKRKCLKGLQKKLWARAARAARKALERKATEIDHQHGPR